MRMPLRLASTAFVLFAALMLFAGTAAAERAIAVERGGEVRISGGRLTFEGGFVRVACNSTFNGALTPTGVKKVTGSLPGGVIGLITGGTFTGCSEEAQVRLLAEPGEAVPLTYEGFLGRLPSITGILATALNMRVQLIVAGQTCEYAGNLGLLAAFPAVEEANTVILLEATRFRLSSGGILCPREGTARATLRMTPAQRLILNGFTPTGGNLTAEENPVIIERRQSVKEIILTNAGGEALSVRRVSIRQDSGELDVSPERMCTILLPQSSCNVTLRVLNGNRPGRGTIRFEYTNGLGNQRLEVPYTIE
jgi:hypothetical protein